MTRLRVSNHDKRKTKQNVEDVKIRFAQIKEESEVKLEHECLKNQIAVLSLSYSFLFQPGWARLVWLPVGYLLS